MSEALPFLNLAVSYGKDSVEVKLSETTLEGSKAMHTH